MQTGYLILAILPLIILGGYIGYKLFIKRFVDAYLEKSRIGKAIDAGIVKIEDAEEQFVQDFSNNLDEITEKTISSVEEAKMMIFNILYKVNDILTETLKTSWHYLMHFFVLLMRIVRDASDWVYVKSRDRFVETAAKERKSVRRFWRYLKEYKKESDSEE